MVIVIKALFGLFWIIASSFLFYLIYIVMQTEGNPNIRWAWMTMSGLTFAAATLLAYLVISSQTNSSLAANAENDKISKNTSTNPSKTEKNTE